MMATGGAEIMNSGKQQQASDESMLEPSLSRQGSLRRVLPSLPGAPDAAKLIDRPGVSGSLGIRTSSQYAPFFVEYSVMPEFNMLERCRIPGVYVIPSAKSPLTWFGVMFVRQGIYQGGVFRFNLIIPQTFPDGGCPKVEFEAWVFHPLICPVSGQLDVARGFPDWNKNIHHMWQVVDFARRCFLKIDIKSPVNVEAAHMYDKQPDDFAAAVAECVETSKEKLFDPAPTDDPHYLSFEPYEPAIHDQVKQRMLSPNITDDDNSTPAGLSWVAPETLKPFSKPQSFLAAPESI